MSHGTNDVTRHEYISQYMSHGTYACKNTYDHVRLTSNGRGFQAPPETPASTITKRFAFSPEVLILGNRRVARVSKSTLVPLCKTVAWCVCVCACVRERGKEGEMRSGI
jgi:hypothetical protein